MIKMRTGTMSLLLIWQHCSATFFPGQRDKKTIWSILKKIRNCSSLVIQLNNQRETKNEKDDEKNKSKPGKMFRVRRKWKLAPHQISGSITRWIKAIHSSLAGSSSSFSSVMADLIYCPVDPPIHLCPSSVWLRMTTTRLWTCKYSFFPPWMAIQQIKNSPTMAPGLSC